MKRRLLYLIPLLAFVFVVSFSTFAPSQPAYAAPGDEADSGQVDDNIDLDCNLQLLNPVSWFVCPIMDGMREAVEGLDDFINKQMSVGSDGDSSNPNQIFCDRNSTGDARKSCNAYHAAWISIRNIALGLMAIAAIIVLICQALGFELLDAYTLRKVLPRLLIAAVAITLSWQLMGFAVELSNDLAYGVRVLIYQPFSGLSSQEINFAGQLGAGLIGISAVTILGWIGLLSYLVTALLAVFVAALVLILRQLLIIMLVIFAPIAIVAYILPNTQRFYKLWWESFSKALLMFALIAGIIAIGRVFAAVSGANSDSGLNELMGAAAYFLPYFLIPFTFKFAGGALAQIGGFVNDRSRGGFDRLKGYRGNVAKKNMADLASGNRLRGEDIRGYGRFAKRFNRGTKNVANLKNAGYNPARMRERMRTAEATRATGAAMEALEKNEFVNAIKADDDLVETALTKRGDGARYDELIARGLTKERATQGVAAIRAAERSLDSSTFDRTMLIASAGTSSGWTPRYQKGDDGKDLWFDAHGNEVDKDTDGAQRRLRSDVALQGAGGLRTAINEKLGNDRQSAIAVLGAVRQQAESKGRFDLVGGSFTEDAMMLEEANKSGLNGNARAGKEQIDKLTNRIHRNALEGSSRNKLQNAHNRAMEALTPVMEEQIVKARQNDNLDEIVKQYAAMENSVDAAAYGAPEIAGHIKKNVLDQQVNLSQIYNAPNKNFKTFLEDKGFQFTDQAGNFRTDVTEGDLKDFLKTTHPGFGRWRREYGTDAERERILRGES